MEIENIKIKKPLLLVETENVIVKGGYRNFSAKVIKTAEESAYKIGDTIFTEGNYFMPFEIDETDYVNYYLINETVIKGEVQ